EKYAKPARPYSSCVKRYSPPARNILEPAKADSIKSFTASKSAPLKELIFFKRADAKSENSYWKLIIAFLPSTPATLAMYLHGALTLYSNTLNGDCWLVVSKGFSNSLVNLVR